MSCVRLAKKAAAPVIFLILLRTGCMIVYVSDNAAS